MKINLNLLALTLIITGSVALIYRLQVYNYPALPIMSAQAWKVEVVEKNYGKTANKSYELLLPDSEINNRIISENIELPDTGISIIEEGGSRLLLWKRNDNNTEQVKKFRYAVEIKPGTKHITINSKDNLSKFIKNNLSEQQQHALEQIIKNSRFAKTGAQELSFCLRDNFCRELQKTDIKPLKGLKLVVAYTYLLNKKGFVAKVALGFPIQRAQNKAAFYSWTRAKIKGRYYNLFIDRSDNITSGNQLIFWNYLPNSYIKLLQNNLSFSLLPVESNLFSRKSTIVTESGQKISTLPQNDLFHNLFSLTALPLGVQIAYHYMLLIPISALVVCIFRLILGIKIFGTFMPVLLAFALHQVGYQVGFFMLFLIIISGLVFRFLLNYIALLSVARISANLVFTVMLIIIISKISWHNNYIFGFSATLFPIIVVSMIIERMSVMITEVGFRPTIKTLVSSLFLAALIKMIIEIPVVTYWSFYFLEVHLIILGLIILIGRYTGYRLTELLRFKDLIKE